MRIEKRTRVDEVERMVERAIDSVMHPHRHVDPRYLDLEGIQRELDTALPGMRPSLHVENGALSVRFDR